MIVATAGHIDHGKTTLVRALTGVDTDRLPEEKKRGISIDLGFAHWQPAPGTTISFVDVPGHEKFVRNMLAGVCAVDLVLLVVAADDGVMPQTIEHLQIVDLLGAAHGLAAITKTDRVTPARVDAVTRDVRALLGGTALAAIDIVPVAATTGAGIATLRGALLAAAERHVQPVADGRRFRCAVDRVFTVAGSGTVVTGTVFDGRVSVNDRLLLMPAGRGLRVRGIQACGVAVPQAFAGQRCALNLGGIERTEVERGDWIVEAANAEATARLDVRLDVLASESAALRDGAVVHFHIGTLATATRVALRGARAIAPGTGAAARLLLDRPTVACNGDRFIVRDASGQRTIGGGVVLDPYPPAHRLRGDARDARLRALATLSAETALAGILDATPAGVPCRWFVRTFNLDPAAANDLFARVDAWSFGGAGARAVDDEDAVVLAGSEARRIEREIPKALAAFHAEQPRALGMPVAALLRQCAAALPMPVFASLLRRFAAGGAYEVLGERVRLAGHVATDNPVDLALWQRVQPRLAAAGRRGLRLVELAEQVGLRPPALKDFLHRKARTNEVFAVMPDRFFLHATMLEFARIAVELAGPDGKRHFTAAQFRDATGIGRGLAIEVLVRLDRLGVTQRIGDARTLRNGLAALPTPFVSRRVAAQANGSPAAQRTDSRSMSIGKGEISCQQ